MNLKFGHFVSKTFTIGDYLNALHDNKTNIRYKLQEDFRYWVRIAVSERDFLETTNTASPIRKETNLASSHDSHCSGITNISYAPSNLRARRIKESP
jgi:hypothetical protein